MKKITQTTLAEALNISRTTVARALNNHPCVDESTRKIILDKAQELGYTQPRMRNNQYTHSSANKEIALLGHVNSLRIIFWIDIVHGLEQHLRSKGYNLRLILVDNEQIKSGHLPELNSFSGIEGIVIIGNMPTPYYLLLNQMGLPVVSYDMPLEMSSNQPLMDVVSLNNVSGIQSLTQKVIDKGYSKLAFAGNHLSSASFYERYQGFKNAIDLSGIKEIYIDSLKKIKPSSSRINEKNFYDELISIPKEERPNAYICANDTIALSLLEFKKYNKELIGDVILTGFDNNQSDATQIDATVDPHTEQIGKLIGLQICNRLDNPDINYMVTRLNVSLILNNRLK